jgi:type IV secretory pathway VirB2 component (pilin)
VIESKLRPKVVLWWGIALTVGGVLLAILLPQLAYTAAQQPSAATGVDQALLTLLDLVVRVIAQVMTPLGVALIGASVVMAYVGRLTVPRTRSADHTAIDQ